MRLFIIATILSSAFAFAPSRPATDCPSQTALYATSNRRQLIQNTASSFLALSFPALTNAADATSYATSIEQSTNLLSQSLGHAILVIDGMNNQAKRLGSSPSPAHPIAVLDGLHAQAKRLTHDLDTSKSVLESIKDQAKEITINDEKLGIVGTTIAHTARKVRVSIVSMCEFNVFNVKSRRFGYFIWPSLVFT